MDLTSGKDNKLEEIMNSMKFMSDQFDSFNSKIDSVLNEIKTLKKLRILKLHWKI
jgi:hypothetical protein